MKKMTFLEQLTGQKRKHSLDGSDASSVEEDFDVSNAFGDKPTPNSGVETRVHAGTNASSDAETRKQLLEWRSHFIEQEEKAKLYNEFELPIGIEVPSTIPDPRYVTRKVLPDIDILIYQPEGEKPSFLCDFCGTQVEVKTSIYKHIKNIHRELSRLSDQERRQQLLEWRRQFVKPNEKVKLYTEIMLPVKFNIVNFPINPSLVTREVPGYIDILKYNPVGGDPVFLCDFCGRHYKSKDSIRAHIKYAHKQHKRLSDQERRQQLLEWRSKFVKPGERLKLYTDIKLPVNRKPLIEIDDPKLVTREVHDDIDILVYQPNSKETIYVCDFCGRDCARKHMLVVHFRRNHKLDTRLSGLMPSNP